MRILLADDHSMVREGLRPFLEEVARDATVVEAADLPQALSVAEVDGAPDLALLDLLMPGMNGTEGVDAFHARFPETPVVILSGQYDRRYVLAAMDKGVRGYIPKTLGGEVLTNALRLVLAGDTYLPASAFSTESGIREATAPEHPPAPEAGESAARAGRQRTTPPLSGREAEILRKVVNGDTNKVIARALNVQEITVKVHLRNIYRKIGAANRAQAATIALENGLV